MRKIGLLCLALVLALGSLGVGYALWCKYIVVSGTVETGEIDAVWSVEDYGDSEAGNKDASSVYAWLTNEGKTLNVTIYDAYPSIDYWVYFDVHSTGSVPIHFCDVVCDRSDFPVEAGTISWLESDYTTTLDWSAWQLHYCDVAYGYLNIHLTNCAQQTHTYTFTCDLQYYNYNETPTCPITPCPNCS